jgi:hypothetical protein
MSRNPKAEPIWIANVYVPGGGHDIYMNEEDADRYNADPDAYAAQHFGLTKIEYLQWIDLDGAPLCGHRTAGGDLCRNMTGGSQLKASKWKARHRKFYCASHKPPNVNAG